MSIYELRREYTGEPLTERDVTASPFAQFEHWYEQAVEAQVEDPNAMALATATREGRPSVRIVLLKGAAADRGVVFYTDYESRKGRELASNPRAAAVFYWAELSRQVRIEGAVERLSDAESEAYFRTRPREAQLAAWASRQSTAIPDRGTLEDRVADARAAYEDAEVPKPPYWGGYRLVPDAFEFWQGRPGRLHDRIRYETRADGGWRVDRLSP